MAKQDKVYIDPGTDTISGNYERTYSIGSRVLRVIAMHRGKWPGSYGRLIGSRLNELQYDTQEERNRIPGIIEEALQIFVDSGEIDSVETTVHPQDTGKVGAIVSYRDRTTGDTISHEIPVAWKE